VISGFIINPSQQEFSKKRPESQNIFKKPLDSADEFSPRMNGQGNRFAGMEGLRYDLSVVLKQETWKEEPCDEEKIKAIGFRGSSGSSA